MHIWQCKDGILVETASQTGKEESGWYGVESLGDSLVVIAETERDMTSVKELSAAPGCGNRWVTAKGSYQRS